MKKKQNIAVKKNSVQNLQMEIQNIASYYLQMTSERGILLDDNFSNFLQNIKDYKKMCKKLCNLTLSIPADTTNLSSFRAFLLDNSANNISDTKAQDIVKQSNSRCYQILQRINKTENGAIILCGIDTQMRLIDTGIMVPPFGIRETIKDRDSGFRLDTIMDYLIQQINGFFLVEFYLFKISSDRYEYSFFENKRKIETGQKKQKKASMMDKGGSSKNRIQRGILISRQSNIQRTLEVIQKDFNNKKIYIVFTDDINKQNTQNMMKRYLSKKENNWTVLDIKSANEAKAIEIIEEDQEKKQCAQEKQISDQLEKKSQNIIYGMECIDYMAKQQVKNIYIQKDRFQNIFFSNEFQKALQNNKKLNIQVINGMTDLVGKLIYESGIIGILYSEQDDDEDEEQKNDEEDKQKLQKNDEEDDEENDMFI